MKLLPRLESQDVGLVASRLSQWACGPEGVLGHLNELQLKPHWNRSGGMPVSSDDRTRLANELRELASDCGYPKAPNLSNQQIFDRAACRALERDGMLAAAGGDTRRGECWAGLTILDMLDLVVWRHATYSRTLGIKISTDRLLGGNRNFLRRLWLRNQALLLDEGGVEDRWLLIDKLTEDALVQIVERPSIIADRRLAQTIAIVWCHTSLIRGPLPMEQVMRHATRRIRAMAEVRMLSVLPQPELRRTVTAAFSFAAKVG